MINPLISIIVPIYNIRGYVEKSIKSICSQTYTNLEIILVDDGSTDGSEKICDYYADIDKRIRVIHKRNGGLVSARKAGSQLATGEYVINVDGDDWIEKEHIQYLVSEGISKETDMVYMSKLYRDYGETSRPVGVKFRTCHYATQDEICEKFLPEIFGTSFEWKVYLSLWSWCMRRELYRKVQAEVRDEITISEDGVCVLSAIARCKSIACVERGGYHYVQRTTSISHSEREKKKVGIFCEEMMKVLENKSIPENLYRVGLVYIVRTIMFTEYERLLSDRSPYLFPYPQVKKGSRIVVYGAGELGKNLVRAMATNKYDYEVVAWVDKRDKQEIIGDYKSVRPKRIKEISYDYVVIAVFEAPEIYHTLLSMNIPKEKIAVMDCAYVGREIVLQAIGKE